MPSDLLPFLLEQELIVCVNIYMSEIFIWLYEEKKGRRLCPVLFLFLLSAGEESRMGIGRQWSLKEKPKTSVKSDLQLLSLTDGPQFNFLCVSSSGTNTASSLLWVRNVIPSSWGQGKLVSQGIPLDRESGSCPAPTVRKRRIMSPPCPEPSLVELLKGFLEGSASRFLMCWSSARGGGLWCR